MRQKLKMQLQPLNSDYESKPVCFAVVLNKPAACSVFALKLSWRRERPHVWEAGRPIPSLPTGMWNLNIWTSHSASRSIRSLSIPDHAAPAGGSSLLVATVVVLWQARSFRWCIFPATYSSAFYGWSCPCLTRTAGFANDDNFPSLGRDNRFELNVILSIDCAFECRDRLLHYFLFFVTTTLRRFEFIPFNENLSRSLLKSPKPGKSPRACRRALHQSPGNNMLKFNTLWRASLRASEINTCHKSYPSGSISQLHQYRRALSCQGVKLSHQFHSLLARLNLCTLTS